MQKTQERKHHFEKKRTQVGGLIYASGFEHPLDDAVTKTGIVVNRTARQMQGTEQSEGAPSTYGQLVFSKSARASVRERIASSASGAGAMTSHVRKPSLVIRKMQMKISGSYRFMLTGMGGGLLGALGPAEVWKGDSSPHWKGHWRAPEPWWAFWFLTAALQVLSQQDGMLQTGETEPPPCSSGRPRDLS